MKIRFLGNTVIEIFDHFVLKLDIEEYKKHTNTLLRNQITKANLDQVNDAVGNTTRKWIENEDPFVQGYFFTDSDGEQIGSCWIMFKGGNEKLYRIRHCDSFVFRLEVNEKHRGKGYSKMIMDHMVDIAKEKGCKDLLLVCATKNERALHLYESIGMKKTGRRIFVRVGNRNIPYYSL
ncbi:MAG: GNAT family N-acetyltransferase [Erysipelotrichaceae bacterium]|nr:GNAT family N-acetyltransferase [Clostridia bacterium]MBQ6217601.1 GNAT family N-acetyltransferase [Erysipelotrichaceae bacterium]